MTPNKQNPAHPFPEEAFREQAEAFARLIDAELLRTIRQGEQLPNLHDGIVYSMGLDHEDRATRGKRIRPVLCMMTTHALGAKSETALAFACAIEMLHNFALVHDDIEDGDEQRRGLPATWRKYGLAHGINIGDSMLARVFALAGRDTLNPLAVREQLLDLIYRTLEHLFIGQSLDISARGSRQFSIQDYEHLVAMKTGSYLVAPFLGGAIIAHATEETIEALTRYGLALGPLFQIKDDIIDLTHSKGRGTIGNDIREGKRSFLVAVAAEKSTSADREQLFDILDKPRDVTTPEDVAWVTGLFQRTGAIERGEAYCEDLASRALRAIERTPPRLQQMLHTATRILVDRTT